MFDPIGAFKKQFTPVEGGYLFYPSRKSGGKLVTPEEYALLVADWERVAGRTGSWKTIGLVLIAVSLWVLISGALRLPDWSDALFTSATAIGLCAWLAWASFAPRRFVANREAVAPPRSLSEARRQARAALNWPFVVSALLLSGITFAGTIATLDGP
jgi:hypothetical protein